MITPTSVIAVDLGNANSSVARYNGRAPEAIAVDGEVLCPSVVTVLPADLAEADGNRILVGIDANEAAARDKRIRAHTFRLFKRRRAEVWHDQEASGEMVCEGKDENGKPNGMTHFQGPDGFTYSPAELEALVHGKLRQAAEARLKRKVDGVVLTVPTSSTPAQKKAAEEGARLAGYEFVETMDEATAAALAYGFQEKSKKRQVIAVVDVGSGTTDVSLIEVGGGVVNVLGRGGSGITGGSDCDRRLASHIVEQKWMKDHPDSILSADDDAMALLLREAEEAKKRLSRKTKTEFRIEDFDRSAGGVDLTLNYEVDRATLEGLIVDLIHRMEDACDEAIAEAKAKDPKFTIRDIHAVVPVGGGTRMPAVLDMMTRKFGQEPKSDIDPEIAVVLGAAMRAAVVEGQKTDVFINETTWWPIAVETYDKVEGVASVIFDKGTRYPTEVEEGLPKLMQVKLVNREAGQTRLPVRILYALSDRAADGDLLHAIDIDIMPGDPRSAEVPLQIALNSKGEPFGLCGDTPFGSAE